MANCILVDQDFDKILDKTNLAIVNTCGAREHVTDAERGIRTIKDTLRCAVAELRKIGITLLPKQVVIHLVYFSVLWVPSPPPRYQWDQRGILPKGDCNQKGSGLQAPLPGQLLAVCASP